MPSESTDGAPCRDTTSRYPDDFSSLASAVADHGHELRRLPNVVGVGVGYKVTHGIETHRRCITVFVTRKIAATRLDEGDRVPNRFHFHLTDVVAAPAILGGGRFGER